MNKTILFLLMFCHLTYGLAEEKKEQTAEVETGAQPDQKSAKELMDLEKQVSAIAAKIAAKETSVRDLIRQKQAETDPEKLPEIIKLLQQEHRDLGQLIKEHGAQMGILNYRFPERGVSVKRKYKRFDSRSLDDMEKSIGLEGHLNRSRDKVNHVYGYEGQEKKNTRSVENPNKSKDAILSPTTLSK